MVEQLQKNNQTQFDFLIVGQGIAGSVLSINLIKAGFSVCVIDNSKLSSCSRVAAGIWNPVVFKRLAKSWMADQIIPELLSFYAHCETVFGTSLITNREIIKPFTEMQEQDFWLKKSESENQYLANEIFSDYSLTKNQSLNYYSKVKGAGNLNVIEFLFYVKKYISNRFHYLEEDFSFSEFKYGNDLINYKNIIAKNIVFCEGHLVSENPFFNWIPTKPAKGEVIIIKCADLNLEKDILSKGIFIMPLGNQLFKVGATYQWDNLNDHSTPKGLLELEDKLKLIIDCSFEVVNHEAGIRPSVIDRRPVVGLHPNQKNMYIFNGFGTKAVMLAPYFATQLTNFISNSSPINPDVNPNRFKK